MKNYLLAFSCVLLVGLQSGCSDSTGSSGNKFLFADTLFTQGDWIQSIHSDNTPGHIRAAITQSLSGGNPGACEVISMDDSASIAGQIAIILQWKNDATYNPSSDPIASIDYSWDHRCGNLPLANTPVRLILKQNNVVYFAPKYTTGVANWVPQSEPSLLAANFSDDPDNLFGNHPDFSSAGKQIQFGYAVATPPESTTGMHHHELDIDNWKVVVNK